MSESPQPTPDSAPDSAPGSAPDVDGLYRAAVDTAHRLLTEQGEFHPFAFALQPSGEMLSPSIDPGEARPRPERVIELLVAAMREMRGSLAAAAVVSAVEYREDGGAAQPAIRLDIERADGDPVIVLVPYARADKELQAPFSLAGEARVFA